MCCSLTLCFADPIWGVCCSLYTPSLVSGRYSYLPPPSYAPQEGALFIWNPETTSMSQMTRFPLQFCNPQWRRSVHRKLQIPPVMNASKKLPTKPNITNITIIAIDIVVVNEGTFLEQQKLAENNRK